MTADRAPVSSRPAFGVFTTDTHLVVRTWDDFLAEITGIDAAAALNRPLDRLLPELEERGLLMALRRAAVEGTVEVLAPALHRYIIPCAPSDRSSSFAQMQQRVSIGPVREEGRITGVAVTIEDVTARVERDRALGSMTTALGDPDWRTRQTATRTLASQGGAIVDTLVRTLRAQHRNFNVLSSLLDLLRTADIDVIEPLLACLADDDADLRIQAALILGERRDARAIPALVRALDDPDVNVRFHAIEAIGTLRASEAAEKLADIAAGGDFFLAFPAIQALTRLGDVSVAPRLVPLLGDDLLRAVVSEALGELGDDLVVEPLVRLLNEPGAPTEVVADSLAGLAERYDARYGAGEHIAQLVRRTIRPAGTQNLLDAVGRVASDRLRGIARVMGWLGGPAVQRALTRLLGQRSVRAHVVEALVRYGAGVVDLLIDQLRAEDLDTRQAAAVALGRIGDRKATRALVAALRDPEVTLPAAGALARLGDPVAFEPLLALLGHVDTAVRQAAIAALNSIGHSDMPARVESLLGDSSPIVRESAVKIAGYFGYPECLDGVLARCADPDEAVRRAAVEHLPYFDDAGAVAALVHALEFDTPPVRAAAAAALGRVEDGALTPLLRALDDGDPWVRYFAVRSLASFDEPIVGASVHRLIETDPAQQVRLAAIDVFGRIAPADAMAVLRPLTEAEDPDIARAAIRAVGHSPGTASKQLLESLARSDEPWRRLEAIGSIGANPDSEAASTLQWVAAADSDDEVVAAAIDTLSAIGSREGDEAAAATAALVALTAEPSRRERAVAALGALARSRTVDVARGLGHLSPDVRRATIEALSRMKNPEASHHIETALEDGDAAVRLTAVAELRRLGSRTAARRLLALARTDPNIEVREAAVMAVAQQRGDASAGDGLDAG